MTKNINDLVSHEIFILKIANKTNSCGIILIFLSEAFLYLGCVFPSFPTSRREGTLNSKWYIKLLFILFYISWLRNFMYFILIGCNKLAVSNYFHLQSGNFVNDRWEFTSNYHSLSYPSYFCIK